jgi:thioredoxin-like negative regulator of GroEL
MPQVQNPCAADLQSLIDNEKRPLLLVFSAEWCGPCKTSSPQAEVFAAAHPEVVVVKLDTDQLPEVAARFMVRAVPTVILLQDGEVQGLHRGAYNAHALERLLG